MRNIHLIPTPNPSRLYKFEDKLIKNDLIGLYEYKEKGYIGQNICITNDEEIKEGDWFIHSSHGIINIYKAKSVVKESIITTDGNGCWIQYCQKIILTDDTDLIKDGVQAIDDEFLEWFCKNSNCEVVEVESFCKNGDDCPSQGSYDKQHLCNVGYKIIIPKEEPNYNMKQEIIAEMERLEEEPKQETLEEAISREFPFDKSYKEREAMFIGAKWQQEQDKNKYSEKDIEEYVEYCTSHVLTTQIGNTYLSIKDWFKQFKKK